MAIPKREDRKKEDFKKIKEHLKNYGNYLAGIKNMQQQLEYNMPRVTASWEMKEEKIGVFIPSSSTEKYAIDRIESNWALKMHEDIVIYQLIVNSINSAVAMLEEDEREFVEARYINNTPIAETADKMGYSERQIYLIQQNVKDKLLISLKNIISLDV